MTPEDHTETHPAAAPPRSRGRRALRTLAWGVTGLLALVLLLGAGAWWWLGSDQSLAFALARTARYLPAGQTLESRDVTGSLRAGGRIGWLRWESESLAVEVRDARIGWQLAPLLRRRVQLGEVHAAQVLIEPRPTAESKPVEALEQIVLPIDVELPFQIDDLRWAGPPALQATKLEGSYRYSDAHHQLEIEGVDIADGHYGARLRLQGPAPMAIDATLNGRVRALLAQDRSLDVRAEASVKGTLAGTDARLAVAAELNPVDASAEQPMRAQLQANLAPWQPQPVIDAKAELSNIDLATLWPAAPATLLSGEIQAGPDPTATAGEQLWQAGAQVRNALPGPWDEAKLPVEQLDVQARFDGSSWTFPEASLRAGGGRIDAKGSWSPAPAPWKLDANVRGVKPGALHTQLDGAPVNGRILAEQAGEALQFDVALQAQGGAGASGELQGLRLERALAKGQWQDQVLDLRSLRIEAHRASLDGRLQLRLDDQAASGRLNLVVPGATALVDGRIAPATGGGDTQVRIEDAAALQRWVEELPGLEAAFAGMQMQGSARLDAGWRGGWEAVRRRLQNANEPAPRGSAEPTLQATLTVPRLDLKLPSSEAGKSSDVQLNGVRAELSGSLARATLALKGEAVTDSRKIGLDSRASGGIERPNQWNATLANLRVQVLDSARPDAAPWVLELRSPVSAQVRTAAGANPRLDVEASAAAATLKGPAPGTVKIDWQPLRFSRTGSEARRAFRLQSKGRLQDLPMAWAELLGNGDALAQVGFSGDLLFNGDWDIDAGDTLRAKARLVRESGDLRVQAGEAALVTRIKSHGTGTASERTMDAAGPGASTPAGLRRAELTLDAEGDTVRANLAWDSERAGEIRVEASTRMQQRQGGWQWAEDAPLAGRVTARMPNLGVWSMLAPPGWRMAGTLEADATLAGSRNDPRWNGTLGANQLAVRALVEGLDLRDGQLRATLAGNRVEVTEFTLKGGAGAQTRIPGQSGNLSTAASEAARDGGTLSAKGELAWGAAPADGAGSGIRMSLQAQLRSLRVLVRADRQVTLSGDLQARLAGGQLTVRGDIKTDRAVIILPDQTAPSLGSDVVIRSAARDREAAEEAKRLEAADKNEMARAQTAKPPDIAVSFDLGSDFAVQGRGITTRLAGKLDIRSTSLSAPPRITGEIRTVAGQYRAYGQALNIETGVARFNGPFDNPQLDILAIRPNISQRAGVAITGTAQSPRVRLYSEPQLSDQETLSWLVLGRASATSGGESVLIQQAALALLGGLGGNTGGGLASRFGLDEIGFKGPGSGGDVRESTVTVGKRVARDFYITYERSLGGTLGTFFIFYDLTRRLTLRAQAGQQSAVDLIYTVQFD
ncbi:translocation/assembly module TamB domain-containing protein [Variovorax saccharolyticus]|uniref:translocation/assembly module TamB domain-containing protein n=1 Tax=Variovorax saccharolyticus TaxID=3053516 RepID=UPI0025771021|nr:translocation/assembly module TamB domain-containing protein [Variovorax sp. J22R187]MDM0020566.1 translocation/assembly module TamB domain-containing protein [Variovorax sp. J22R187]